MNKKLKKRKEKRLRESIHRILDLVLDINGLQSSEQELTGNHPTAFMEFYGHTGEISVRIYKDGWYRSAPKDFYSESYVYRPERLEKLEKELRKFKEEQNNGYKY